MKGKVHCWRCEDEYIHAQYGQILFLAKFRTDFYSHQVKCHFKFHNKIRILSERDKWG